jgi:hypothetical protein
LEQPRTSDGSGPSSQQWQWQRRERSFGSGAKCNSDEAGQARSATAVRFGAGDHASTSSTSTGGARAAQSDASSTGDALGSSAGRTATETEDACSSGFEPANRLFRNVCRERPSRCRRRRRRVKFRRFIACEAAALLILALVILGLTLNITAPALRWILNIFTIAAAVAVAVIPIVFYAFTPTLPDLER